MADDGAAPEDRVISNHRRRAHGRPLQRDLSARENASDRGGAELNIALEQKVRERLTWKGLLLGPAATATGSHDRTDSEAQGMCARAGGCRTIHDGRFNRFWVRKVERQALTHISIHRLLILEMAEPDGLATAGFVHGDDHRTIDGPLPLLSSSLLSV